jgi:hypothetical protein
MPVATNGRKPKIPVVRVPSDGCMVTVGQVVTAGVITSPGTGYSVHKGEWVEILPAMTVQEVIALTSMQRIATSETQDAGEVEGVFRAMVDQLAKRVTAWNWTDMMGEPHPQPYGNPAALLALTNEELLWLVQATSGQETPEERKNDSGPLPFTSSVATTAPVRNRMRAS